MSAPAARHRRAPGAAGLAVPLLALGASACAAWPCPPAPGSRARPVVVVGIALGGEGGPERARERAAAELEGRLRFELSRRESAVLERARPGERVRDEAGARRELAARARALVAADGDPVRGTGSGDAFLAARIDGGAFDEAVEAARAAGRAAPLRVALVPLAVSPGRSEPDAARELWALRDHYTAALREALAGEGGVLLLEPADVYAALEATGARADRPLEPAQVVAACARLGADALAHGSLARPHEGQARGEVVGGEIAGGEIVVLVELRDGRDGRLVGSLDGTAPGPRELRSLAARHALLWREALGVESVRPPGARASRSPGA